MFRLTDLDDGQIETGEDLFYLTMSVMPGTELVRTKNALCALNSWLVVDQDNGEEYYLLEEY